MAKKKAVSDEAATNEIREEPLTLTLSPQGRGEGTGAERRAGDVPMGNPSCDAKENPLTLTLSPQGRGEGTGELRDRFAAGPEIDVGYISPDLRALAIHIDSLVLDDCNIKDHDDNDLPAHAASLKQFGICRALVVRRSDRKVLAGNGCVMACRINGWDYAPVSFVDFDDRQAAGFAIADNLVGTLATINEENLASLTEDLEHLFPDSALQQMMAQVNANLESLAEDLAEEQKEAEESGDKPEMRPEDVVLIHRVIVRVRDQEEQAKILAEMTNRGHECRLSTIQDKSV
jgi:hypothetical protein